MNEKKILQKVTILGLTPLDFNTDDGSHICGYTIHYYRDSRENENVIGKVCEKCYLAQDNLNNKEQYKLKTFPIIGTIEYEFISLQRKPKAVKLII